MRGAWFVGLLLTACSSPLSFTAPPWGLPGDVGGKVRSAGLDLLPTEGVAFHIHAHLDVFYGGQAVGVPGGIGIAEAGISPLHTHAEDGILHVESPVKRDFTLGQFFLEWDVPLGGARAWVNGSPAVDPAAIVLTDHQAIVVAFGDPPVTIPSAYPTER